MDRERSNEEKAKIPAQHTYTWYCSMFEIKHSTARHSTATQGKARRRTARRRTALRCASELFIFILYFCTLLLSSLWSQVSSLLPPLFLPSIFTAHRVQQSHCSSIFHRVLLTHALALSASQFVHKKKSPRLYTNMHSGGFELTNLTYTRLEDNLIRHRGDQARRRTARHLTALRCASELYIAGLIRAGRAL